MDHPTSRRNLGTLVYRKQITEVPRVPLVATRSEELNCLQRVDFGQSKFGQWKMMNVLGETRIAPSVDSKRFRVRQSFSSYFKSRMLSSDPTITQIEDERFQSIFVQTPNFKSNHRDFKVTLECPTDETDH